MLFAEFAEYSLFGKERPDACAPGAEMPAMWRAFKPVRDMLSG